MNYPITERTYFADERQAYRFAQTVGKLQHYIVIDYGVENDRNEPYYVETMNDPFSTKDELLRRSRMIAR